ncbi:STAS domain-containing protein [Actinomadura sp. SCN-SB]|uniref:STAS domain-containing protein n=1 Tax=Actinomadura sp. SCN-SB TaxID=3373092 RepID=UPI00375341F2
MTRSDPAVVRFPAEVDLTNGELVLGEARRALRSGAAGLVLDLSGCAFCDSAGPNAIFRSALRADAMGVPVVVVLPRRGIVRKICDIAGVTRRLTTVHDLGAARRALSARLAASE